MPQHKGATPSPEAVLRRKLQTLIAQKKYPQAIKAVQQAQKQHPELALAGNEAELWLLQGRQGVQLGQYVLAEKALRSAIELGLCGDSHYWLARCLLAQQKTPEAVAVFEQAFDAGTLPKDWGGAYLKLLFLNRQSDRVRTLIKGQGKRFASQQLHWAWGVLSLLSADPQTALSHFRKMRCPASPEDHIGAWVGYALQCQGDWDAAEQALGLTPPGRTDRRAPSNQASHPLIGTLAVLQVARTDRRPGEVIDLNQPDGPFASAMGRLELVHLMRSQQFAAAAHRLLDEPIPTRPNDPELGSLCRPLLLLAGEQAMARGDHGDAISFWTRALELQEFEPALAVRLYKALDGMGKHSQAERLVKRLIQWVRKEAQTHADAWPDDRLAPTLAKLHCWLADNQMGMGHSRAARSSLQAAVALAPRHPDVLGRQGLDAYLKDDMETAITLLTEALETGCDFLEVYKVLLESLDQLGDQERLKVVRRRFGQAFGDIQIQNEVVMPAWVEALSFQNFHILNDFIHEIDDQTPAAKALRIFLDCTADLPIGNSHKVTLTQESAVPQWEELLASNPPAQQVDILKSIYLVIQQHAKRNRKGMAALQGRYFQRIIDLTALDPDASQAHLMLLALRQPAPEQLSKAVHSVLNRAAQPGHLLARAQLELRIFDSTAALKPFLDEQLVRESQNPLLLLAKATLYPTHSKEYKTHHSQGFELARRLQDAEALQAYRVEEWVHAQALTRRVVGQGPDWLGDPSKLDMMKSFERMAQEIFGAKLPPELLAEMLPSLESIRNGMLIDDDEEEDDDDDDDGPSFPLPQKSRKSSRKRKPWYEL